MASFWKSNPRHWCELCRCWTADNKASISFHELGQRHKEAVDIKLKSSREKTARDNVEQRERDDIMAQINRDALAAMNADVAADPSLAKMDSSFNRAWTNKRAVQATSAVTAADILEMASKRTSVRSVPGSRDGSAIAQPAPPPAPDPAADPMYPWTEQKSPAGHVYYYNSVTMESRWTKPGDTSPPTAAAAAAADGDSDGDGDSAAEVWAEISTDDGKTYYLNAKTGETSWTKPDPKPAPKPAVAETEAVKPEEAEAAKGEKETGEKESGVNADITAKAAAAADGAVVGDGDWAYTAEEAAENDKAAKKPEPEAADAAEEAVAAGVGKDRSVPAHLVAKAVAAGKTPAFKVKRPTKEGIIGGWSIVTKSTEEDLLKTEIDDAAAADADADADVPSSGVDENGDAIRAAQTTKSSKASLTTIDNSGVQFTAKAMPALKRRGPEGDAPVMMKKKKRKGNQNFKRREKQF